MPLDNKPGSAIIDVSICIISYNQEKYIGQAIESALMQKYSCISEIIICDDCSTDNTPAIIKLYADKYPELIKVHPSETNIGMLLNWQRALNLCKGKYICLLEGDDFWNDENKLEKQYQILETHPDCSICFTNANNKYENAEQGFPYYVTLTKTIYTTLDLLEYNFVPTCSAMMRNHISDKFFPDAYFKSPFADWVIHILNSRFGNLYFLNELTCTYRFHGGGVWGGLTEERQLKNKLRAIECIAEIIEEKKLTQIVKLNRKVVLQKLCAYFKEKKQFVDYLKYRFKLLLN